MAAAQNFRSAFNGFNREDVVHYLEYLNTKHQNQINQFCAEIDSLRAQLDEQAVVKNQAQDTELLMQCQELKAQVAQLEAEKQALEERCSQLECTPAAPTVEPELNSYRRAQDVERESRTRAELVYFQTSGILSEASAKVDSTANEITELADSAMRELTRLQVAVSESKHALQDAAVLMKSIRPNT